MRSALIGASGFVGGNLRRQRPFDDLYRSTNIDEIVGREYDLVVCAGAPAVKWKANKEPEADLANLRHLMDCLGGARAGRMILISTVDVYPDPQGVDESTPIDPGAGSPYGRHRLMLENMVRETFPTTTLRLPGLFGSGLKKNVIFDLLHGNHLAAVSPESVFQFYCLNNLWRDVETMMDAGLVLLNVATEPVSVRELAAEAFGLEFTNPEMPPPVRYDFRSQHAAAFGGRNGYLYDRTAVLEALRRFVHDEGWTRG
jgi:nucleoside-diphosphate-sugar epimerase